MKIRMGGILLAAFSTCAATVYAQKPVAKTKEIVLPLSDAQAACDVAITRLFTEHRWHWDDVEEARKTRTSQSNIFVEAYDNIGREVTPATTLAKLRLKGFNVHPAWTEKSLRPRNEAFSFGGSWHILLGEMKVVSKGHIQWEARDHGVRSSNDKEEGGMFQGVSMRLKKQNGRWRVTEYNYTSAAG